MVFIMALAAPLIPLRAQDAQQYYDEGLRLKTAGDIDGAIRAFEKAAGRDHSFAEAYYQLGMCYMTKLDSPSSLKRAETAIIKARTLDWDNVDYLFAMGEINENRLFFSEARRLYEKVLEKDPDNVKALGKIAEIHARKMKDYQYRVDVTDGYLLYDRNMWDYYNNIYGGLFAGDLIDQKLYLLMQSEIEFSEFAQEDFKEALEINRHILTIDPGNRDALFRMGLLYFDNGDLDNFVELFAQIVDENPDDKDANLFLGLALAEKGEHDLSYTYYMKARSLMDAGELTVFEDIGYINSDYAGRTNVMRTGWPYVSSGKQRFWERKDPFFMTPYNERRLAHYGRVAEANLRFSIPRKKIPGWMTDRGRIFIRYGRPEKIKEFHQIPDLINAGQLPRRNLDGWDNWRKHQFWYYNDFTLVFNASYADRENKYKLSNWQGLNFKELEKKIEEDYPDYYTYKPRGELVNFPVDAVGFRGKNDKTHVRFFYGMPLGKIRFHWRRENEVAGRLQHGVFVFDEDWRRVTQDIDTLYLTVASDVADTRQQDIVVVSKDFDLDPGRYNFGVEVLDPESGNAGAMRDTLRVDDYRGASLQVSDMLLAHRVLVGDPSQPVSQGNVTFFANPLHKLKGLQSFFVYIEIYNLFLNPENHRSSFVIDLTIYPTDRGRPSIRKFLKNLVGRAPQGDSQSISFKYSGSEPTENILQNIDLQLFKPGEYRLTLQVTDLLSGGTAEKSTIIWIFEQ